MAMWLAIPAALMVQAAPPSDDAPPPPPPRPADWEQDIPQVDPEIIEGASGPATPPRCPIGSSRITKAQSVPRRPKPSPPTNCRFPIVGD